MPIVVDKQAKREQILAAALQVLSQKGVKGFRMTEIAEAAKIGKGTVYEYFRSKDEVLTGAFQYFLETIKKEIDRRIEPLHNPEQRLHAFIQGNCVAAVDNAEMIRLMLDIWAESIRGEAEGQDQNLRVMYETYRQILIDILEEGIAEGRFRPMNTLYTAAVLIASLDGILLQWVMDRTLFDLNKVGDALLDTFLMGIKQGARDL